MNNAIAIEVLNKTANKVRKSIGGDSLKHFRGDKIACDIIFKCREKSGFWIKVSLGTPNLYPAEFGWQANTYFNGLRNTAEYWKSDKRAISLINRVAALSHEQIVEALDSAETMSDGYTYRCEI